METRNSTDKNLHFGDIHELVRRVNEAPTPSWQKSTEMSKPKKVSNRKRMSQDSKSVPEFHSSTEVKADAEVPKRTQRRRPFQRRRQCRRRTEARRLRSRKAQARHRSPPMCKFLQKDYQDCGILHQLQRPGRLPSRRCG